jgi:hypothetical protein
MDPAGFIALGIIASLLAWVGVGGHRENRDRRRARRILRTARPLFSESPEGHAVRTTGVVSLGEDQVPLRSKLCAKPCVIYRTRILARDSALRRRHVSVEMKTMPFILDCGMNGRLEVESEYAVLDLERVLVPFQLRGGHDVDYDSEQAVEIGTTITVAGVLAKTPQVPTTELGYRDLPALSLRLTGSASHPIAIALSPGDSVRG